MSRFIPKNREDDVLHMYWQLLTALEWHTEVPEKPLDRMVVEAGYRQLRELGYAKGYAKWHEQHGEVVIP